MREESHYEKLKSRSSEERLQLIQKWSTWFYDQTETFEGKIGMQLAYLWAAIAKAHMVEAESDTPLVQLLEGSKVPETDPIWDYIDVVDPEEEEVSVFNSEEPPEFCPHGERFDPDDPCPDEETK